MSPDGSSAELVKGDTERSKGKLDAAIEHDRRAWQHALRAAR